jgi:hypothetical protein
LGRKATKEKKRVNAVSNTRFYAARERISMEKGGKTFERQNWCVINWYMIYSMPFLITQAKHGIPSPSFTHTQCSHILLSLLPVASDQFSHIRSATQ